MKEILCFGDSNTYGFIPAIGGRYPKNLRWTGILQKLCRREYKIIEAGCNNRTGFMDNPDGKKQTGYKALPNVLKPNLEWVILSIGVNDLQFQYNASMPLLRQGLEELVAMCRSISPNAKILIMAPPKLTPKVLKCFFSCMFDQSSIEKSQNLATIYEQVAQENDCEFMNLEGIAEISSIDGLHYSAKGHKAVAQEIFNKIIMK